MYCTVPTTVPPVDRGDAGEAAGLVVVKAAASTEADPLPLPPAAALAANGLARPKSRSLAPDLVSITLPGFRSRCTTPARCAFSSASAMSIAIFSTCSVARGPFFRRSASVSPSRILHHQEVGAVLMAYVVQHADVRMLQLRDDFGFALEAGTQLGVRHQLRVQNLDSDGAIQAGVARAVDFAHSAGAQWRLNFIGTELRSRCNWHECAPL